MSIAAFNWSGDLIMEQSCYLIKNVFFVEGRGLG